jgi:hypothetical protein
MQQQTVRPLPSRRHFLAGGEKYLGYQWPTSQLSPTPLMWFSLTRTMQLTEATTLDRKSGEAEGSAVSFFGSNRPTGNRTGAPRSPQRTWDENGGAKPHQCFIRKCNKSTGMPLPSTCNSRLSNDSS